MNNSNVGSKPPMGKPNTTSENIITSKVAAGPAKMGVVKVRAKEFNNPGIVKPVIPPVVNKQPL